MDLHLALDDDFLVECITGCGTLTDDLLCPGCDDKAWLREDRDFERRQDQ